MKKSVSPPNDIFAQKKIKTATTENHNGANLSNVQSDNLISEELSTCKCDCENSGLFIQHIDKTVRPQDDLFRFMNGKWLSEIVIPADRAGTGAFYEIHEAAEKNVRLIIEECSNFKSADTPSKAIENRSPNQQKIGDLYQSFMDEARINELGVSPILNDIENSLKPTDRTSFISTMAELESRGRGASLFYLYINTDDGDSTKYIANLGQAGLSLPDEAYYREDEYAPLREKLITHIEKMFNLVNTNAGKEIISDVSARAKVILELETKIAAHHWDQVKCRDASLTYNKMTFDKLKELAPNFNWSMWLQISRTPEKVLQEVIAHQPSYFTGLNELISNFDSYAWNSWLTWHLINSASPYLSQNFIDEHFDFYGKTLSGIPELRARWKRGVGLVEGALGEAVGQIYVERHFPAQAKARMKTLVDNLIESYRQSINELEWMTPETKAKALVKLTQFTPKIGYPDKWRNYSELQITPDDLITNLGNISTFASEYEYAKIGGPVDKSEWFMTPQTVNAYYNPGLNEIVFPAAILQPPFFDLSADDAANYGGIGAVIGHEIGHGFDDQGSKYDGLGNLNNWWSDLDRLEFEKRAQVLIEQYNELSPSVAPDVKVNGALTIGENIGDLGGAVIAFKAYLLSFKDNTESLAFEKKIHGYNGAQRFFLAFSQTGRALFRPEEVKRRIATDPHSPDEFRVNQIVKNMDEFVAAFDLKLGDALYLPSSERVKIW